LSVLDRALAHDQRRGRVRRRTAHDRAGRKQDRIEPLLDGLQRRDRVAECDVDAARLQHRHGKAPLSNFVTSTSRPSALKNPWRSAITAPSDSENGSRPSRIFSCAVAASADARTPSRTSNEHTMGRKTATAAPVLFD
jgi:hypothetical protein